MIIIYLHIDMFLFYYTFNKCWQIFLLFPAQRHERKMIWMLIALPRPFSHPSRSPIWMTFRVAGQYRPEWDWTTDQHKKRNISAPLPSKSCEINCIQLLSTEDINGQTVSWGKFIQDINWIRSVPFVISSHSKPDVQCRGKLHNF